MYYTAQNKKYSSYNIYRLLVVVVTLLYLTGCARTLKMQMMPRENGKIYEGIVDGNGFGSGTMTIKLDNRTCSGKFSRGTSNDSFGFFQSYGNNGSRLFGATQSIGSTSTVKSLMSCTDGTGLRCDFVGGGGTGTGICVDSNKQVFDVLVN